MNKKILIITAISIFTLCLLCNFSFATENSGVVGNIVSDATNVVKNGGQMVGNAVEGGAEMINDGTNMLEDSMTKEGNMIENGVTDTQTLNDIGGDAKNATDTMTDNGVLSGNSLSRYKFLGINLSVWLWIVLIIIIIVVIILICRYMQKHEGNDDEDDE